MAQAHSKGVVSRSARAETLDIGAELNALVAELDRGQKDARAGYLTARQMAAKTGRSRDWIRQRLVQLNGEGRLATQPVQETDIAGRANWKTAYRILPKGKARKEDGR